MKKKLKKGDVQYVALSPLMPSRYSVEERRELREFEHRIIGVSRIEKKAASCVNHFANEKFF